jgi:hypothetical protein
VFLDSSLSDTNSWFFASTVSLALHQINLNSNFGDDSAVLKKPVLNNTREKKSHDRLASTFYL